MFPLLQKLQCLFFLPSFLQEGRNMTLHVLLKYDSTMTVTCWENCNALKGPHTSHVFRSYFSCTTSENTIYFKTAPLPCCYWGQCCFFLFCFFLSLPGLDISPLWCRQGLISNPVCFSTTLKWNLFTVEECLIPINEKTKQICGTFEMVLWFVFFTLSYFTHFTVFFNHRL